jgi:cbb3-type cytochrome oxidase subunit 3
MAIGLLILFLFSILIGYFIILLLRKKSKNNLETVNNIRLFDEKQNNFIYQLNLLLVNIGFINKAKSKLIVRFIFPGKESEFIEKDYTFLISEINKLEKEQKELLKDVKREVDKIPKNMSNDFSNIIAQNARRDGILDLLFFVEGILAILILELIIKLI